jgi:hypothetical protein
MKLPFVRVLPVVFALLMPATALAEAPADSAPMGTTASHAGAKAKGHAKPAKKSKPKSKAKRAKTPSKSPKAKSSAKKAAPKG